MLGRKRHTGTKQTKKITILSDVSSLFVLSQCVSFVPTWRFLHHVTVSCKRPIDDQILPEDIGPEVRDMFRQFLRENPSKVLLVLDGLDEADPEKLKLFRKLIQRELLPGCFIVLTSRHEVGSNIRPYTETLLEIVGFTTTDAESFIGRYFQQPGNQHLADTLIAKLRFKNLYELIRNPLNTLLLCVIFEDFNGVLPNSRTELFIEIVLFVLRRYETKNGLSISDKDLLLVYKKELMILGRMALGSLRKGELYFEDHQAISRKVCYLNLALCPSRLEVAREHLVPVTDFSTRVFKNSFQPFSLPFLLLMVQWTARQWLIKNTCLI